MWISQRNVAVLLQLRALLPIAMHRHPAPLLLLTAAVSLWFSGCASYHRFRPTAVEFAGISARGKDTGDMSDAAVVAYADRVRDILRKRFHIARNVRQTSATAQVLLAGAAGFAGAFEAGATTVAALAGGSAAIPQLGDVFDAGGRANAYQQSVAKISEAEGAYFLARAGRSPVVPDGTLTTEGALLLDAVNAATDAVEQFQAGMLPTLDQLTRAEALELRRRAVARTGARLGESRTTTHTFEGEQASEAQSDRARAKSDEASRQRQIAADEKARRDQLRREADALGVGGAAAVLQQPGTDDVTARRLLGGLIADAKDPLLRKLEERVQAQAKATPDVALNVPVVPAQTAPSTTTERTTPPTTAEHTTPATPPARTPPPTTAERRKDLTQQVMKLPTGGAAKIVQPSGRSALDDGTARKLLSDMVQDAEDPLLLGLEKKVRAQAAP